MRSKKHVKKQNIVWTDKSAAVTKKTSYNMSGPPRVPEEYVQLLIPGSLWIATTNLGKNVEVDSFVQELTRYFYEPNALVRHGSIMIYASTIRRDELCSSSGRTITVPRHTFICANGRYVINDLTWVKPVK